MMDVNSKIVAKVGLSVITEDEVDAMIEALAQRGQNLNTPEGRKAVIDQLVNKHLFLSEAKKNFYEADPAFKAELAKLKDDMLANFAIEKALNSVTVKEEEVQKLYDEHKSEFMAGESVEASHILVDTEEKANEILAEIKAETISFEDAARKYSSCPSSSNGGALGEFGRGQMVPEFDTAVFAMNVGEVSEPVKTQFGYHLIKLTNKKEAAEVPYAQMRERLYQMVLSEKQRAAYNSKVNQLKIMFPVDIF